MVEAVLLAEVLVVLVVVEAGTVPVVVGPTTDLEIEGGVEIDDGVEVDGGVAWVIGPIVGACVEAQALTNNEPSAATDVAPSRHRRAHGEAERRPKQITCC